MTKSELRKIVREELKEQVPSAGRRSQRGGSSAGMGPENVFYQIKDKLENDYKEVAPNVYEVAGLYWKPGTDLVRVYEQIPEKGETYHDGYIEMQNYPFAIVGPFKGSDETVEFKYVSQFIEDAATVLATKLK